jgi:FAD-dependent monooxygenase
VGPEYPFTVRFSSGLRAEKTLSAWNLPSVEEFRDRIVSKNDGTMPLEPWQRLSGDVFEAWLKERCDQNPIVDVRFGWTVTAATECDDGAEVLVTNPHTGISQTLRCRYAVGCEGASSSVRKSLGIEMEGGQM